MTKKERIEMLARLCWDYMIELNKVDAEGYEVAAKLYNNDPDTTIEQLKLIDKRAKRIRNKFVFPMTDLLHSEGVQSMEMEDGKLKLLTEDKREIVVDVDGLEPSIERFL